MSKIEDGLLGKKLYIVITDDDGEAISKSPEFLKWTVEEITEDQKKYPLNHMEEHLTVHQQGFKGTVEGEEINDAYDSIVDAKISFQEQTGGSLKFAIHTTKTYKDGTVQKYEYPDVIFSGFCQEADGNNKALTNKMRWQSGNRKKV
jgi:hypothetical protein